MAIMKQWAKREEQIMRVMGPTVGMYRNLQEIAGKSLQQIEGLEFPALELLKPPCPDAVICTASSSGGRQVTRFHCTS